MGCGHCSRSRLCLGGTLSPLWKVGVCQIVRTGDFLACAKWLRSHAYRCQKLGASRRYLVPKNRALPQPLCQGGNAPEPGQTFRSEAMAATLELIAETKGKAFYRGELAEKMIAFSDKCGGVMAIDDLAEHQADWCGTVSGGLQRLFEIHEIPPNGQGISALMALGILGHFPQLHKLDPDGVESIHLQVEAMKLAFADLHQHVADLDHMAVSPDDLLKPTYLAERAALLNPSKSSTFAYGTPAKAGTIYLTAADESGMMVSYIQSNYMGFGSGVVVPRYRDQRIQNRGCGFRSQPGHVQFRSGRASDRSTRSSLASQCGTASPRMSFGVMGGPMQPQGHVQILRSRADARANLRRLASDAPRWQVMEGNGTLAVRRRIQCQRTLWKGCAPSGIK